MQKWLITILVCAVNVFILAYILPGVEIRDMFTALWVAIVISILNLFVRPLLIILTLPATVLTLGLFLFVINACIILIADHFIGGFNIVGFWYALLFSLLLSILNSFIHKIALPERKRR